ncbi:MAG: glycosyltransferase [Bacteroidetes bacterium]|nr:glycosyltransferase [Bacteroidota bacterium]MDA1119943.1 glycosyltransferase [Bacteroidota bacterium]
MDAFIIIIYFFFLIIWVLYTLSLVHLSIHVEKERRLQKNNNGKEVSIEQFKSNNPRLPVVTVQVPLYNELYVAERVIDCIIQFDYPSEKLEIQILDDSTDETYDIVASRVKYWQAEGVDIKQIHRTNRTGYKAGALAEATPKARGEFIALFDADFLPDKDFLLKTLPYFDDPEIGAVQARWGHLNGNYSLLTKLQTLSIDAFFLVEQFGRSLAGYWLRFNGSGGLWRASCIEDAGGWSGDTLSEDLDLAFRAQLKGWKFRYANHIECKGELPVTMDGVKKQYYRWSKGKTEVVKKLSLQVLKAKIPLMTKIHAFADLWNIWANIAILAIAILSLPFAHITANNPVFDGVWRYTSIGLIYTVLLIYMMLKVYYFRSNSIMSSIRSVILDFPAFAFLFTGITLHQNVAIFDGYRGKKTAFERTPKYDIQKDAGAWTGKSYTPAKLPLITYIELLMAGYFAYGVYLDFVTGLYGFLPWHIFLSFGASYTFWLTVKQNSIKNKGKKEVSPQLVKA